VAQYKKACQTAPFMVYIDVFVSVWLAIYKKRETFKLSQFMSPIMAPRQSKNSNRSSSAKEQMKDENTKAKRYDYQRHTQKQD
jgi:hypothetical protein